MACYHPLRAVLVQGPEGRRLAFTPRQGGQAVSLPCGRCIGCRLERARQWAVRLMHEAKMHDESSFITLTYDNEHLPKGGTLSVEDCQNFMKRLRFSLQPKKIRFFLCGEYGEKLGRPHYHAIIFGHAFPDKVPVSLLSDSRQVGNNFQLYDSNDLQSLWGKGNVRVGEVNFETAAYVSNYATKKVTGPDAPAHYQGRRPEFLLMSRGGRNGRGIGYEWYKKYGGDVFPSDEVIVRGKPTRPPRYYDKVLEADNPQLYAALKKKRTEEALELEKLLDEGPVTLKKAAALLASGAYPKDRRDIRLAVQEKVATAKAALKTRKLESKK